MLKEEMTKRLTTMGLVVMLLAPFFTGCQSNAPVLDAEIFYKRDMPVTVVYDNESEDYQGIGVLKRAPNYKFILSPKGVANKDLVTITTCHREVVIEDQKFIQFDYTPVPGIEDEFQCLIQMSVLDAKKGKHAWAVFDIQGSLSTLPAFISCNGTTTYSQGVSVCQSKAGLVQRIVFDEEVDFVPDKCPIEAPKGRVLELKIPPKKCVFAFKGRSSGRIHRLTTLGYESVPIREVD